VGLFSSAVPQAGSAALGSAGVGRERPVCSVVCFIQDESRCRGALSLAFVNPAAPRRALIAAVLVTKEGIAPTGSGQNRLCRQQRHRSGERRCTAAFPGLGTGSAAGAGLGVALPSGG